MKLLKTFDGIYVNLNLFSHFFIKRELLDKEAFYYVCASMHGRTDQEFLYLTDDFENREDAQKYLDRIMQISATEIFT